MTDEVYVGTAIPGSSHSRAKRSLRFPTFRLPVSASGGGRLQIPGNSHSRALRSLRFPTFRLPVSATGGGRLQIPGNSHSRALRSLRFPTFRLPVSASGGGRLQSLLRFAPNKIFDCKQHHISAGPQASAAQSGDAFPRQADDQPFTAPIVMPRVKNFWNIRKIRMIGIAPSEAPAMMRP